MALGALSSINPNQQPSNPRRLPAAIDNPYLVDPYYLDEGESIISFNAARARLHRPVQVNDKVETRPISRNGRPIIGAGGPQLVKGNLGAAPSGTPPNVIKQPSQKLDSQNKKTLIGFLVAGGILAILAGIFHWKEPLGKANPYAELTLLLGALTSGVIAGAGALTGSNSQIDTTTNY